MELNIRYYTCKICNTSKEKELISHNKAKDSLGNIIYNNTCYDCANKRKLENSVKVAKPRDPLHTCKKVECSECKKSVNKINIGYYCKNEAFIYADENGRKWSGKKCPDCSQDYYKQYRAQLPKKEKETRACENCSKEFLAISKSQKFCSKECGWSANNKKNYKYKKQKNLIHSKSCVTCSTEFKTNKHNAKFCQESCKKKLSIKYKPKPKPKKEYIKNCKHCNKEFKTNRKHKQFCKPGHMPSSIKSRKQRKKRDRYYTKFKNPLSKSYKKEIIQIYENKPDGMEVDHIVPRNHPDVCGLHVPWNLQYLTREENQEKSNGWIPEIILKIS